MSRTLVWMTHSFREDSRLTSSLNDECAFVYYSPFYFAGQRELEIYRACSQDNLNAFYSSINSFDAMLKNKLGVKLYIYRGFKVIEHINMLIRQFKFDKVVIDQPLFSMWHGINVNDIQTRVEFVDSDLIDPANTKMTAKSRYTAHLDNRNVIFNRFSKTIKPFKMHAYMGGDLYPLVNVPSLVDTGLVNHYMKSKIYDYHLTRDRHDGQTRMSTALHNGVLDPCNTFYDIETSFGDGSDDGSNSGSPLAAILRQQAFREISIIRARRTGLTLEDEPVKWAKALMHSSAFDNMMAHRNPDGKVTWDKVKISDTGDQDLDFLIKQLNETGIMPNRARMYYASKVFYESPTGLAALNTIINTFDLLGMDGQSPNNYVQSCSALGLTYGKVLKMNRDNAFKLLAY